MKSRAFLYILIFFSITGCVQTANHNHPATGHNSSRNNLTPGMIEENITENKTTKNEIIKIFGSPNIITKNKSGLSVWTYEKQSITHQTRSNSVNAYGTIIVSGVSGNRSNSTTETSTSTITLMITFNNDETVNNYSMISTKF